MTNIITKKIVGTAMLVVLGTATLFVGTSIASAQFTLSGKTLQVDGYVSSVTPDTLLILTSSTDPLVIGLTNKTKFVGFGSASAGDFVSIVAEINGQHTVAKVVKKSKGGKHGDVYGTQGDQVLVKTATVTWRGSDYGVNWLTVSNDLNRADTGGPTDISFRIVPGTKFVGTANLGTLPVGATVTVIGRDTASKGFVAEVVTVEKKGGNDHGDDDRGRGGDR